MRQRLENGLRNGAGKTELRRVFRRKRNALSDGQRTGKSLLIGKKLERLPAYRAAKRIMFFVTHGSEVRTEPMMERAWKKMKDVVVPLVKSGTNRMVAAHITSVENDLETGFCGVREPKNGCRKAVPETVDLVLVPGLVFDRSGHRLGYGKGFYDRWLKKFPVEKRIGVCFDCQVIERLPKDEHDVPVAAVITEKRIIRTVTKMK